MPCTRARSRHRLHFPSPRTIRGICGTIAAGPLWSYFTRRIGEPVSTDQLGYYNDVLPQVRSLNAELIGVSVDSVWCHEAFTRAARLRFRLLSDTRGAVARAYGVYTPREGRSARALFVIDTIGNISWGYVAPPNVNPGVDGMMTALERMMRHQRPQGIQDQDEPD